MQKGLTLIEFIIYLGILSLILFFCIGFLWNIIFGSLKEASFEEVQQNTRFALTKMTQEIKKATRINSPSSGSSTNTLSLEMAASSSDPTIFEIVKGKLRISQGNNSPCDLTSDQVTVSSLRFSNLSYSNTPGIIRIEMAIEHQNPQQKAEYQAQVSASSSVSLVPGGASPPSPFVNQTRYRWRADDGGQ